MKRLLYVCAVAMSITLLASLQAYAQYNEDEGSRLSIKLGVYMPSGSKLHNKGNSMWGAFGANYALKLDENGKSKSFISIEHVASSKDRFKGRLTSLQYTTLLGKKSDKTRGAYFGVGAGIFLAKEEVEQYFYEPGEKCSATKIGFTFLGGYDLGENWFAELQYTALNKLAPDVNFSGLTFYVGAKRFF